MRPEQALLEGRLLSPWSWDRLVRTATVELIDQVLDRLEQERSPFRRRLLVEGLARLAARSDLRDRLASPERLARLAETITAGPTEVPVSLTEALVGPEADHRELSVQVGELLRRLGPAAVPLARALLDGPLLPVVLVSPPQRQGVPTPLGASFSSVAALAEHGNAADVGRLTRVFREPENHRMLRLRAALAALGHGATGILPELAAWITDPHLCHPSDFLEYGALAAAAGVGLVPGLLALLDHKEPGRGARAAWLLEQLGAVDELQGRLAVVAAESRHSHNVEYAEDWLAHHDRAALAEARAARHQVERGLSLADAGTSASTERGLSPADEPDGAGPGTG